MAGCDEHDLDGAMDWFAARQEKIEDALAALHLAAGLVLDAVSAAAFEGRTCRWPPSATRGRLAAGCISSTGC